MSRLSGDAKKWHDEQMGKWEPPPRRELLGGSHGHGEDRPARTPGVPVADVPEEILLDRQQVRELRERVRRGTATAGDLALYGKIPVSMMDDAALDRG